MSRKLGKKVVNTTGSLCVPCLCEILTKLRIALFYSFIRLPSIIFTIRKFHLKLGKLPITSTLCWEICIINLITQSSKILINCERMCGIKISWRTHVGVKSVLFLNGQTKLGKDINLNVYTLKVCFAIV